MMSLMSTVITALSPSTTANRALREDKIRFRLSALRQVFCWMICVSAARNILTPGSDVCFFMGIVIARDGVLWSANLFMGPLVISMTAQSAINGPT